MSVLNIFTVVVVVFITIASVAILGALAVTVIACAAIVGICWKLISLSMMCRANLLFPFLFYNFHALQAKDIGYKYLGGYCEARNCKDLYLVHSTGWKPKFCSPRCRNYKNVNLTRDKLRREKLAQSVG